jgi:6,7-dimethyl-8-ribityllumazine synthase
MVLRATKKTKATKKKKVVSTKKSNRSKIAIVMSQFNEGINRNLLKGCKNALADHGIAQKNVDVFEVAGAFEIPLMAKKVALKKRYKGIVVIGSVIRGDTPHFEYVSQAVTMGSQQASLDTMTPLSFAVITVDNVDQALDRSQDNEYNKGREAAYALMKTLETVTLIK